MEGRRDFLWLAAIISLAMAAIWVIQSPEHNIRQGLDLQGGLQVLLEADVPPEQEVTSEQMRTARQIIEQRINALGAAEPIVQTVDNRRILVELPGLDRPEDAIALIQGTALLEFIDTGATPLPEGMCVRTTLNVGPSPCEVLPDGEMAPEPPTFETVMTGAGLISAQASRTQFGENYISFILDSEAGQIFSEYTAANQGNFLTIVLDKQVISSPRINSIISTEGSITGNFTPEEAQQLALQLRFGSLPIPLEIMSVRQVGATLGDLTIQSSIRAGAIGLLIVLLFMLTYYRLPGLLADTALLLYAVLNFAVYMLMSNYLTLTLPAITGFLLSTGMAVDANILIFERMKEELRKGASLREAIVTGFSRAWSSIRDSNVATLVVCFILWGFGRNFGASAVQGFAMTLGIGVSISLFTAVIVTRTFVRVVMGRAYEWIGARPWLLGV
jgi:protein-export membrane protein SecD